MTSRTRAALALGLALVLAVPAAADEVWLKNGDRLTGKIEAMTKGKIVVVTPWGGKVTANWADVVNLKTDATIPLILTDQTRMIGILSKGDGGQVQVRTPKMQGKVRLGDVEAINPPPPEDKGIDWSGFIRVGAVLTDGNTRTREANAAAQVVARAETLRLTLRALWNYGENRKGTNAGLYKRNALGEIKLDVFVYAGLYLYANAMFMSDRFQDLDLRSVFGAGAGYQWVETKTLKLMTEGGLAYVVDDRGTAKDEQTLALRLAWAVDWSVVPERLTFFHIGELLPSIENQHDVLLNASTGVRIAIVSGLFASAQVDLRYDNTPAPGFGRKDWTYTLGIGYEF